VERLELSKADLQADMDQQLSNLHDVIAQKETAITSVSQLMYVGVGVCLCAFSVESAECFFCLR